VRSSYLPATTLATHSCRRILLALLPSHGCRDQRSGTWGWSESYPTVLNSDLAATSTRLQAVICTRWSADCHDLRNKDALIRPTSLRVRANRAYLRGQG
jgi:hypothetical protein